MGFTSLNKGLFSLRRAFLRLLKLFLTFFRKKHNEKHYDSFCKIPVFSPK